MAVGTNAGSAWTRPGSVPSRSDTVLITSNVYDSAGRTWKVINPKGQEARTEYDALGRTTKTIENYVNGTVSDADDKTTEYTYSAAGMTSLTAKLTGGGGQTTEWVYGVTLAGGNGIESNDVVGKTKWPDPSTGSASASEQETVTVNALGQTATSTDRNGSVHTLTYDILGRITKDAVTTLGTNVDGAVRRVETGYDSQGNAFLVTTYNASSGGSVVNEVKREFNGLGQLTSEWQEHAGAVTGSSLRVQYAYTLMASGANHSRPTTLTYPNGKVLTYNYSSGLNDTIGRLSSLSDTSETLESYDYLGLGSIVRRGHSQPGVDLTYIKQGAESTGDAGDQYTGLDRFDRVVDQRWRKTSDGSHTDRFQYGYDRNSNRTYRDNLVNTAFGELYTYDGLNQVASFARGTLNGTKDGISGTASRTQSWDFDALGNWDSLTTDSVAKTRTHNKQNEITAIQSQTTPTYDANGNMTGDETGKQFVYDAWNRHKVVKSSGGATLETLAYDALGRRVSAVASSVTTDLYYANGWQVVEDRIGGVTAAQYVWSLAYVDALVLRDRDTDANGSLDERLWPQQDANWNVTAILNGSGVVQERYGYDSFGAVTMYSPIYGVLLTSGYAWVSLYQGRPLDGLSGTYNFRQREVSPTLGRPLHLDPLGLAPDVNAYRWEENNPIVRVDPFGLYPITVWAAAFIPGRLGTWLDEPLGPGDVYGLQFKTDGRGFGGNLRDSRLYTWFVIDSEQIGKVNGAVSLSTSAPGGSGWTAPIRGATGAGASTRRLNATWLTRRLINNDPLGLLSGQPITTGAVVNAWAVPTTAGYVRSHDYNLRKVTDVVYHAAAAYPFLPGPNIDMYFDITFYKGCVTVHP